MTKTMAHELTRVIKGFHDTFDGSVTVYADGHPGELSVDRADLERDQLDCTDEDGNLWYIRTQDVTEVNVDSARGLTVAVAR